MQIQLFKSVERIPEEMKHLRKSKDNRKASVQDYQGFWNQTQVMQNSNPLDSAV